MPFHGRFQALFEKVYTRAIDDAKMAADRADAQRLPIAILEKIWKGIQRSSVVLADVSEQNLNVYYEVGLAHAARKPVIFTTSDMNSTPFDTAALFHLTYNMAEPDWGERLRGEVKGALEELAGDPRRGVPSVFLEVESAGLAKVSEGEKLFAQMEEMQRGFDGRLQDLERRLIAAQLAAIAGSARAASGRYGLLGGIVQRAPNVTTFWTPPMDGYVPTFPWADLSSEHLNLDSAPLEPPSPKRSDGDPEPPGGAAGS
jgi:hypothetical protein